MGAPFDTGTWNGVDASYYMSGWEGIWLTVSSIMCLVALYYGVVNEKNN